MIIIAKLFRILFKFPFFRKRYFGFYKRIFKPNNLFEGQTAICTFDKGLKINAQLSEWIQQHIYFLGIWDKQGTRFIKNHLKKGNVFFDIGANIGYYSLIVSKQVGENGQIHAFEPVSGVFAQLQSNIELNGISNISANQNAVYEKSGTLDLFVSSGENTGMSSIFHHDTESGVVEKVDAITIDDYVEKMKIDRIDLIKIDIEGAELFALKGMKNTLQRFKPMVFMELSQEVLRNASVNEKEIIQFMAKMDYELKGIDERGVMVTVTGNQYEYANVVFCMKS